MNSDPRKQRAQGFIVVGLTTLAYIFYSVVLRSQPLSTLYYVMMAVGLVSLALGVFFLLRNQDR